MDSAGIDGAMASALTAAASYVVIRGAHQNAKLSEIDFPSAVAGPAIEAVVRHLVPPQSNTAVAPRDSSSGGSALTMILDSNVDSNFVVQLLTHWRNLGVDPHRLVLVGDPEQLPPFEETAFAGAAAGCAVRAAYHARDALVREEPSASRSAVAEFASRWLGLPPTDENVEATGNALLQAPLDGVHPDGDHAAVRRLPTDVRDQRRMWRPLGRTRIRSARVASLDRPVRLAGGTLLTLADTVAATDELEAMAYGWDDMRVERVLEMLGRDERRVALALAGHYAGTWEQAAVLCGYPCAFGERVRRKLKRKGAELHARQAAAARRLV
ncbi:hypothetical protein [Paractinoplanes globisporus]|uniref:Uncharacterized protein n=1 Tax=Paractinoplanes globisporus TaxID=113565 RepID=A0ABW6WG26_9ACTN|nr:hypothetical protein [Actinoplanes globisporus]